MPLFTSGCLGLGLFILVLVLVFSFGLDLGLGLVSSGFGLGLGLVTLVLVLVLRLFGIVYNTGMHIHCQTFYPHLVGPITELSHTYNDETLTGRGL